MNLAVKDTSTVTPFPPIASAGLTLPSVTELPDETPNEADHDVPQPSKTPNLAQTDVGAIYSKAESSAEFSTAMQFLTVAEKCDFLKKTTQYYPRTIHFQHSILVVAISASNLHGFPYINGI